MTTGDRTEFIGLKDFSPDVWLYILDDDSEPRTTWAENDGEIRFATQGSLVRVHLRRRCDAPEFGSQQTEVP